MSFSIHSLDKAALLLDLRTKITSNLDALERRQRDIQAGATHEENRAEHAKDTRATEQGYLARGLAARVDETQKIADILDQFAPRSFGSTDPIGVMALVAIRDDLDSKTQVWWLVPGAGGIELTQAGLRIKTLTPAAPLGQALIGLCVEDEASFTSPSGRRVFQILEIA